MAATIDYGEGYRTMLEKLNELEATKRLLEYDVQTQLLKTEEINATRKTLEDEIRELEAEIVTTERALEQTNLQLSQCQEAQLSIERSIEHETSSHATLKQELEETMTTRRQRVESLNCETCRYHYQIHEVLGQVGVESALALQCTTDAEAQAKADAKITSAHADIDARITAALKQDTLTRGLTKKHEALLRSVYTCFKQAHTSLQKRGDLFETALLKTHERVQQLWPHGDDSDDPVKWELKIVDRLLQADVPESCLKAFGDPPPSREVLVVALLMKESDWIFQPTGYLVGNAFLQNILGESRSETDVPVPQSTSAGDETS